MKKTILDYIGNTPLLKIYENSNVRIFAKMENMNPSGSIKDRIAVAMIKDAMKKGLLKRGDTIIEPSSGNTGISLAMVGAIFGLKLTSSPH